MLITLGRGLSGIKETSIHPAGCNFILDIEGKSTVEISKLLELLEILECVVLESLQISKSMNTIIAYNIPIKCSEV